MYSTLINNITFLYYSSQKFFILHQGSFLSLIFFLENDNLSLMTKIRNILIILIKFNL